LAQPDRPQARRDARRRLDRGRRARSREGTAQAPATEGDGPVSQQAQADAHTGAFRALGHQSWVSGLLMWDWSAEGRVGPGDYSAEDKQAQTVMRRWFGGGAAVGDATG
jgi:hypothetical protein